MGIRVTIELACVTPELLTYQLGNNLVGSLPPYFTDVNFDLKNVRILLLVENKESKTINFDLNDLSSS